MSMLEKPEGICPVHQCPTYACPGVCRDGSPQKSVDDPAPVLPNSVESAEKEFKDNMPVTLEDFDFSEIQVQKNVQGIPGPGQSKDRGVGKVVIEGQAYPFTFTKQFLNKDTTETLRIFEDAPDYHPDKKYQKPKLLIQICFAPEQNKPEDESIIKAAWLIERIKQGEKSILPKGVGMDFIRKLPNYLQNKANAEKKDILDTVTHDQGKEDRLSPEKWDKTFVPVLTGMGYKRDERYSRGVWTRLYTPEQK